MFGQGNHLPVILYDQKLGECFGRKQQISGGSLPVSALLIFPCKQWLLVVSFAAILLGSITVPYEELKRRIIEVDEDQLTPQVVEQLIKYMPQPEQMSQLAELKGEYKHLAEPEQFGVVVSCSGR